MGVLISGRGTNLQALIDGCADRSLPAEIALVVSNVRDAAGLNLATAAGISTRVIDHKGFEDRPAFEVALTQALEEAGVPILNITTSEIRISCLVPHDKGAAGLQALHDAFGLAHVPAEHCDLVLLTAGMNGGGVAQVLGQIIWIEGFHLHLHQAVGWYAEVNAAVRSIHYQGNPDQFASVSMHNFHRFVSILRI